MSTFTEPILSACIVLYHSGMDALQTVQCFQESDILLELHVVDHSPGATLAMHMQWQCPGIQYYPQPKNLGFAGGHNIVLNNLRSQYHLICHPDVTFDEKLLTNMVAYMEHNPNCVILSPKIVNAKGEEQFMPRRSPTLRYLLGSALVKWGGPFKRWHDLYTLAGANVSNPTIAETASGCFLLMRTDAFRSLQGFSPEYFLAHGDSDLCRRAREIGAIVYHPEMIVIHHPKRKADNLQSACTRMKDALHFLRKWRGTSRPPRQKAAKSKAAQ